MQVIHNGKCDVNWSEEGPLWVRDFAKGEKARICFNCYSQIPQPNRAEFMAIPGNSAPPVAPISEVFEPIESRTAAIEILDSAGHIVILSVTEEEKNLGIFRVALQTHHEDWSKQRRVEVVTSREIITSALDRVFSVLEKK